MTDLACSSMWEDFHGVILQCDRHHGHPGVHYWHGDGSHADMQWEDKHNVDPENKMCKRSVWTQRNVSDPPRWPEWRERMYEPQTDPLSDEQIDALIKGGERFEINHGAKTTDYVLALEVRELRGLLKLRDGEVEATITIGPNGVRARTSICHQDARRGVRHGDVQWSQHPDGIGGRVATRVDL